MFGDPSNQCDEDFILCTWGACFTNLIPHMDIQNTQNHSKNETLTLTKTIAFNQYNAVTWNTLTRQI